MRYFILFIFAIITFLPTEAIAQSVDDTVLDSLMNRWVEIYNTDNSEALVEYYADNVVLAADTFAKTTQGKKAVIKGDSLRMTQTHGLKVHPLYSYKEKGTAYQIGRWLIHEKTGPITGAYTFIWKKIDGDWKLRYTYYLHDPVSLTEEFQQMAEE